MEPQPAPAPTPVQPAPIMDVAPPSKKQPALAEPPAEDQPAEQEPAPAAKQTLAPLKTAAHKEPSNLPVVAITLAVIFFLVLSALAFYAYTKSK